MIASHDAVVRKEDAAVILARRGEMGMEGWKTSLFIYLLSTVEAGGGSLLAAVAAGLVATGVTTPAAAAVGLAPAASCTLQMNEVNGVKREMVEECGFRTERMRACE